MEWFLLVSLILGIIYIVGIIYSLFQKEISAGFFLLMSINAILIALSFIFQAKYDNTLIWFLIGALNFMTYQLKIK